MLGGPTKAISKLTLPETGALPSARSTRQSPKNTRQKLCRVSHSAKKARHTVHRRSLLCRVLFLEHSEKRFAERQRALGKEKQPLRRRGNGDGFFAECPGWHSAKKLTLPSVCPVALGKEPARKGPHDRFFAECSARHSAKRLFAQVFALCRVLWPWHSAKRLFTECYTRQSDQYIPFFCIPSTQTKDITYISHIYITNIITNINSQHKHKTVTTNINIHHKHKCSTRVSNTNISHKRRKLSHKYQTQT
jgi:hypothetical protein